MARQRKYAAQTAWKKRNPWARFVEWARRRCNDPKHKSYASHGAKGITVTLTAAQAKILWERDGAASMKIASLDRIDAMKNYTFENCRFLEKSVNERLPHDAALRASIDDDGETFPDWVLEPSGSVEAYA